MIGRIILPVCITIALNRILGPQNVGAFAALMSFMAVVDLLRDFGIGQNFITDREASKEKEGQYFTLSLILNLIVAAALLACAPLIVNLLKLQGLEAALVILAVSAAVSGVGIIPGAALQKAARFRDFGIVDVIGQVAGGATSLVLALTGYGVWSLVWAVPVRTCVNALGYCLLSRPMLAKPDRPFFEDVLSKALATLSNSLLSTSYTMGDTALVQRIFGSASAGYYSTAFNIAMRPVELVSWPLGRTLLVTFSEHREDSVKMRNVYARALAAIVMVVLPIFLVLAMFPSQVMTLLYGEAFAPSGPILQVLCIYLFARSLGTLSGAVLVAIRRPGLSNYGWLGAFVILGIGLATGRATESLQTVTWWFTSGAVVAFGTTVGIVLTLLRPTRSDFRSLGKALFANIGLACVLVGLYFGFSGSWLGLALGLVCLPLYFLTLVHFLTGSFRNAGSRSGLKTVWEAI